MKPADAIRATQVTTRLPAVHGAPVHIGFPEVIGIRDLGKPDYGDAVPIEAAELPVFWAIQRIDISEMTIGQDRTEHICSALL